MTNVDVVREDWEGDGMILPDYLFDLAAKCDTLEAALNVIDRRADDALAALFGIADNNEARPRVARALTAIQQIREALTPDEPSAFPEEGCVCMECEAARAALGGNEK